MSDSPLGAFNKQQNSEWATASGAWKKVRDQAIHCDPQDRKHID
jgi:hypothetical protein